jgi:thymidylate synthase (FAD)
MKIIDQSHEILSVPDGILQTLERAGRTCYKSEDRIDVNSAGAFVEMLIKRGHHAMIEFGSIIVKFVTNRGVTHELVRHRLCSFAQESTRYVDYQSEMEFIRPVWDLNQYSGNTDESRAWAAFTDSLMQAEEKYKRLRQLGWRPEQAREVLPNSLKTEIVVQANIREWRHIFKLRTAKAAHPQMRALMLPLLDELRGLLPVVFDDI